MSCTKCKESNDYQTSVYLIEVCNDLNDKYFEEYNANTGWDAQKFGWIAFTYENSNYACCIKFCDMVLWCSENDEREYCEDCNVGNPTESVGEFVERKYREYVRFLYKSLITPLEK